MRRSEELKQAVKRTVLSLIGRRLRCELCDEVLVTAVPIIWKGQVKLLGAEAAFVAVDFASMNRLAFRHADAASCSAQRMGGA